MNVSSPPTRPTATPSPPHPHSMVVPYSIENVLKLFRNVYRVVSQSGTLIAHSCPTPTPKTLILRARLSVRRQKHVLARCGCKLIKPGMHGCGFSNVASPWCRREPEKVDRFFCFTMQLNICHSGYPAHPAKVSESTAQHFRTAGSGL